MFVPSYSKHHAEIHIQTLHFLLQCHCGPCVDIPLSLDTGSLSANSFRIPCTPVNLSAVLGNVGSDRFPLVTAKTPPAPPSAANQTLRLHRTIVLLI